MVAFRVDRNLRKSVRALQSLYGEHNGCGANDRSGMREGSAAVAGGGEHDRAILAPYGIELAIWADGAVESLRGAVVIARQARMRIDLDRLRPCLSIVGGAGKHHLRVRESPAGPSDVEIAGILALRIVGHDVWLVFKRNPRRTWLFRDRDMMRLPGFSAIERSPHKDSVARGVMRPVIERTQLVESDVTNKGVTP